jgi:hypothetical protein
MNAFVLDEPERTGVAVYEVMRSAFRLKFHLLRVDLQLQVASERSTSDVTRYHEGDH